ncbi:MAG: DNA gyrase inhibitor YacG [Amphritea sp.]
MKKLKVDCPQCGKKTLWSTDNSFRPFCSERCRMIDLGAWASEDYQIPTEPEIDDYSSSFEDPESGMLQGSKNIH